MSEAGGPRCGAEVGYDPGPAVRCVDDPGHRHAHHGYLPDGSALTWTVPGVTAALCPEHRRPLMDGRLTGALAVILGWRESTVLHACEARFEMRREADGG